jgi:hypothetical protein
MHVWKVKTSLSHACWGLPDIMMNSSCSPIFSPYVLQVLIITLNKNMQPFLIIDGSAISDGANPVTVLLLSNEATTAFFDGPTAA